MDSRQSLRSLGMILIASLFITQSYAQNQSQTTKDDDSTSAVEKRINALVEKILSSIDNEMQMTFGHPVLHEPLPEGQSADSSDSSALHDEFIINGTDSTITFNGDNNIGINDTIRGFVVVRNGSLTVNGVVEGDVIVYEGNIIINRSGIITGDATAVHGTITKNDGGTVGGVMYETSEAPNHYRAHSSLLSRRYYYTDRDRHASRLHGPTVPQFSLNWLTNSVSNFDPFIIRYNRVDGLFLGLGRSEVKPWEARKNFALYGSLGYGFALHRWQYNLGWDLFAGPRDCMEAGIEYHDITDTRDSWIMNRKENSAAAFFIHEDFFDYYGRRGFNIHGSLYPTHHLRARFDYLVDDYESLPWKTDWSLFGGNKHFRPNPPIFDGLMRSVVMSLDYSTIDRTWWQQSGWNIHASAEYAGNNLGGDFSFHRYLLDIRRYEPIGNFSKLSTRVRVGSSYGTLPYQKIFEFGGIGTLPAYAYKEFFGNRMVLVNFEYLIHGSALDNSDFWPIEILSPFSLVLFLDAGWADCVPARLSYSDGFNTLTWNTLKSDVGFGIGSRDGTLRIAWAWRTDQQSSPVLFFRVSRPF